MGEVLTKNIPLTVDNKGRLTIPKNIREALHIENGDVLLLKFDSENGVLQIARAIQNPIEALSKYADKELDAGRTKNIRELLNDGKNDYFVHVTKSVEDDLKEFGPYKARVIQEILQLESNPLAGHALRGKLKGLRSLEFSLPGGECRAIYKIKDDKQICLVVIVGYHENIYDKAQRRVEALVKNGLL